MAPVPVTELTCDGNAYKCTAHLVSSPLIDSWFLQLILTSSVMQVWGNGNWVAQWDTSVFHNRFWVQNVEPNKSKCTHRCVFVMWCCTNTKYAKLYNSLKLFWKWDSFCTEFCWTKIETNYLGKAVCCAAQISKLKLGYTALDSAV